MKTIFAIAVIMCAMLTASAQMKDGIYNLGKDDDGDTWYLDSNLVIPIKTVPNHYVMSIYMDKKARRLFFMFHIDCTDNTYRLIGARAFYRDHLVYTNNDESDWANFKGYSGRAATMVCKADTKLPVNNKLTISE